MDKLERKKRFIQLICCGLLMISIGLKTVHAFNEKENFALEYEYINIKDMAQTEVYEKKEKSTFLNDLMTTMNVSTITPIELSNTLREETMPKIASLSNQPESRRVWYLPTEMGKVSQYPSYYHAAYDITSPRGSSEPIFPIANGVISSIYTDNAGALVVSVLHEVNGVKYTSLYAHLSRYAQGLYVGKPVTINDSLGQMGTTGYSTGVHLHIVVLDCALFDPNDANCSSLNNFFNYGKRRISQGFIGLGSVINVPPSWETR